MRFAFRIWRIRCGGNFSVDSSGGHGVTQASPKCFAGASRRGYMKW